MGDRTGPAESSGSVPDVASGAGGRRCRAHRAVVCALALVVAGVAAAVVASFVPRGHQGRRRLRRARPWHRRPGPGGEVRPRDLDGAPRP
ncbi:hypothetical protein [Actinomadura chokoriensis]|uniref:hypothetical protein n=1 Tax=Actinomadura chokoriensis TaxID=454156 RepID=UPI0031F88F37